MLVLTILSIFISFLISIRIQHILMTHSYEMIKQESLTSFPRDFINSTSSGLKLAMDIDCTLCGGVKPRSIPEHEVQTNEPIVILICGGPLW